MEKNKFKTFYDWTINKGKSFDGMEQEYKYDYDENGSKKLVPAGKKNLYAEIQTYKDDCNIYTILSKYSQGDLSVLDKNKGIYADVSQLPDNLHDFNVSLERVSNVFDSLPTNVKSIYNNDVYKFVNAVKTGCIDKDLESLKNDNINIKSYTSTVSMDSNENVESKKE